MARPSIALPIMKKQTKQNIKFDHKNQKFYVVRSQSHESKSSYAYENKPKIPNQHLHRFGINKNANLNFFIDKNQMNYRLKSASSIISHSVS